LKAIKFLTALLLAAFIAGCGASKEISNERILSPERLITKLEANRRKVRTFSATGTINIKNGNSTIESSIEVNVKKPDSVRVDVYGPFGVELAQILITRDNFLFYDAINKKAYKGKTDEAAIKKALKIELPFDMLIDAFTGGVDLSDKLRTEPDDYVYNENYSYVKYVDSTSGTINEYEINTRNFTVNKIKAGKLDKGSFVEAKYENYKEFENILIPLTVSMNFPENGQSLFINYKKVSINDSSLNILFELPSDTIYIEL
jgi:outer membrane lipoprotein-sorting protein